MTEEEGRGGLSPLLQVPQAGLGQAGTAGQCVRFCLQSEGRALGSRDLLGQVLMDVSRLGPLAQTGRVFEGFSCLGAQL